MIKTRNGGEEGENQKLFLEIKFNSDDDLSSNKIPKLHVLTVIIRK